MNRFLRPAILKSTALAALLASVANVAASAQPDADPVARGKYLVTLAACNDCHTPMKMGPRGPERDTSRLLSGHPESVVVKSPAVLQSADWQAAISGSLTAYSGPWGVSFGANLTPDEQTGLGRWTLRNFLDTFRNGRHLGQGRPVLPPMPVDAYKEMTDEDIAAIFAYLRSIPAVKNRVPQPLPPAPARNAGAG